MKHVLNGTNSTLDITEVKPGTMINYQSKQTFFLMERSIMRAIESISSGPDASIGVPSKRGEENKRNKIMVRILPNLIKLITELALSIPEWFGHPTTTTAVKIWIPLTLRVRSSWVLCPQIQRTDCIFLKNDPVSNWTCAVKTQELCVQSQL